MFFGVWDVSCFKTTGETILGRPKVLPSLWVAAFSVDDKEVKIELGALDEAPTTLTPTNELWVKRREAWLHPLRAPSNLTRIGLRRSMRQETSPADMLRVIIPANEPGNWGLPQPVTSAPRKLVNQMSPASTGLDTHLRDMEAAMRLVAIPDKIIPQGGHTLIIMADGETKHAVCVQCETSELATGGHDISMIEHLASMKTERGERAYDGSVWISASELRRQ
jgi:hypothetical protein